MLQRMGRVAERVATSVSRRTFLGKLGRGALAVAGVAGGFLISSSAARADGKHCCLFSAEGIGGGTFCFPRDGGRCPRGLLSDGIVGFGAVKCSDPRCG
jgi:hypothetical protein